VRVFNLFSKRQKQLRGEFPEVFVYDTVPMPLRVQIVHIVGDVLGNDEWSDPNRAVEVYKELRNILAREYGVFSLGQGQGPREELLNFFLQTPDTERALDCVELFLKAAVAYGDDYDYKRYTKPSMEPKDAIAEVNLRFKEHGIGYQFADNELLRVDSQLIHANAVIPALHLLSGDSFSTANQEFLRAFEHYRHGRNEEAIADALKSLESVLKVIAFARKWPAKETDTAKVLLDVVFQNGLIPAYLQSEFGALRSVLESGVPTVRNRQAGHGQGVVPRAVPDYLVSYILHLTASSVLFLVSANKSMP